MRIYHTCASRADVETAREHAPSHEHGYGWLPVKMCAHPGHWFLDAGTYGCDYRTGDHWRPDGFVARLEALDSMPSPPDFVVLPDVPGSHTETVGRTERHYRTVASYGVPMYFVVQPGAPIHRVLAHAERLKCAGLFLAGADKAFAREIAPELVDRAHAAGLKVHVGQPGSLVWAHDVGVDSVDTSSIVRGKSWHRLDRLEAATTAGTRQATLGDVVRTGTGTTLVGETANEAPVAE